MSNVAESNERLQVVCDKLAQVISEIRAFSTTLNQVASTIKSEIPSNITENEKVTKKRARTSSQTLQIETPPKRRSRRFWQVISVSPPKNNLLLNLPLHLLEHILSLLDASSVLKFSQVCKYTQSISYSNTIWSKIMTNQYPVTRIIPLPREEGEHCYDYFYRRCETEKNWRESKCVVGKIATKSTIQFLEIDNVSPNILFSLCKNDIMQWDLKKGQLTSTFSISSNRINHFAVDCFRLVVSDQDGVTAYDRNSRAKMYQVGGLLSQVNRVTIAKEYLILGLWDGYIQIHNIYSGTQSSRLVGHNYRVNGLDLCSNILASASSDKTIKLWNITSSKLDVTLKGHTKMVNEVQFASNESVFSASKDSTVRCWNINSQSLQRVYETPAPINSLRHGGAFKFVTGGDDKLVRIWDSRLRDSNHTSLQGHTNAVTAIHLDEWRIVSGSSDRTIRLWDFRQVDNPLL